MRVYASEDCCYIGPSLNYNWVLAVIFISFIESLIRLLIVVISFCWIYFDSFFNCIYGEFLLDIER